MQAVEQILKDTLKVTIRTQRVLLFQKLLTGVSAQGRKEMPILLIPLQDSFRRS